MKPTVPTHTQIVISNNRRQRNRTVKVMISDQESAEESDSLKVTICDLKRPRKKGGGRFQVTTSELGDKRLRASGPSDRRATHRCRC